MTRSETTSIAARGIAAVLVVALPTVAAAEAPAGPLDRSFGVHAIFGTDVTLGLAGGAGASVLRPFGGAVVELGVDVLLSHASSTDADGIHDYTETTDLVILAIRGNRVFGYDPRAGGTYYVAGTGVAGVSMEWEESSPTDTSLGTPLPGGGSKQDASGTVGALILNVGVGRVFASGLDVRLELPVFLFVNAVGGVGALAPTIAATGGYRF